MLPSALALVAVLMAAETAAAQSPTPEPSPTETSTPGRVTLRTDREVVRFGGSVSLSGRVDPPTPGAEVDIIERDGTPLGRAVTDEDGRYVFRFSPERNLVLTATWTTVTSDPVRVGVRPRVSAHLGGVNLFGRALVRGRVQPAIPDQEVEVLLRRNGDAYRQRAVRPGGRGRFRVRLRIGKPGSYRAVARYGRPALVGDRASTESRATTLPSLRPGSSGSAVKRLEGRLRDLGYYLPSADRRYDHKTADAVIAFNKIQGRARVGDVDASTWKALASPKRPRPRVRSAGHIEIDQTRQVILVVKRNEVRWILHTSTGAGGATRDGVYRVFRKIAGYSGGGLYYPSYFDGLRAIHGWEEVPTYPASHGCARVPMWSAQWIHGLAEMGTEVRVYH